jgi:hypothetical protein
MPSFLKHVFTFCERDSPYLQASFQSEDYLNQRGFASGQQPRRNEVRIQHCFNLLGLEYDAREEESIRYKYRQAAAYYSFEPISGQSVMIILKANRVLQDAVAQLTKGPHTGQENSFWTNTKVHAAICEWSIQNWTSYFDHIEAKIAKLIMLANYISVSKLTNDRVIAEGITRKSTMQTAVPLTRRSTIQSGPSRTGSTYSQILDPTQWPGWRRPIRLDNLTRSGSQEQETESDASADEGTNQSDVAHIFKFDKLQALYRHAGQLQNAASVLTQNKVVMQDMIKRFTALGERDAFSQHVQMDQEVNHKFLSKTERCIRELESQQVRLGALQASVDRHISLFNGILQYNNMRIGELYAQLAKSSTDKMEELTEKTKHETVSIHVITFLTLVFLPGTFVATFFGSGVIDFENGKSTSDWGYWTIRRAALRLFCAVFLPLTFAVLGLWALAYFQARRRHAIARALAQGDEEKNQ